MVLRSARSSRELWSKGWLALEIRILCSGERRVYVFIISVLISVAI